MFGAINLEFTVCSFSCVRFVLNSHCSHTPCFPCVAAFMKAICREHWEQTCHFSSVAVTSPFVLVPITGGGAVFGTTFVYFLICLPNCQMDQEVDQTDLGWTDKKKKWAKLTKKWTEFTRKLAELTRAELTLWAELTWAELELARSD